MCCSNMPAICRDLEIMRLSCQKQTSFFEFCWRVLPGCMRANFLECPTALIRSEVVPFCGYCSCCSRFVRLQVSLAKEFHFSIVLLFYLWIMSSGNFSSRFILSVFLFSDSIGCRVVVLLPRLVFVMGFLVFLRPLLSSWTCSVLLFVWHNQDS